MAATETPSVHVAWAAVMADVREVAKGDRNDHQRFMFRGIDAVMNAVGPALRRHGVSVVPEDVEAHHRDVQTTQGKSSREATVLVRYRVYGPAGDSFPGAAPGESMDAGDKGTPKAMSVAFRTFLLQSLCLPTHDTDPDAQTYERSSEPTPQQQAQDVAGRLSTTTDLAVAEKVAAWCAERDLLGQTVLDQHGNELPLGRLLDQHMQTLQTGAQS